MSLILLEGRTEKQRKEEGKESVSDKKSDLPCGYLAKFINVQFNLIYVAPKQYNCVKAFTGARAWTPLEQAQ